MSVALCVGFVMMVLPAADVAAKSALPEDAYWQAPKGSVLTENRTMTQAEVTLAEQFSNVKYGELTGTHRLPMDVYKVSGKRLLLQRSKKGVVKLEPEATYLVWVDTRQLFATSGSTPVTGEISVTKALDTGGFCRVEFWADELCYFSHVTFAAEGTTAVVTKEKVPLVGETGKSLSEDGFTFTLKTGAEDQTWTKVLSKGKDPARLLNWVMNVTYLVQIPPVYP